MHIFIALVAGVWLFFRHHTSPWRKLPSGPRGLPLVGNIRQLTDRQWLFRRARKEHGDVVYLSIFGKSVLLLNSQKAATDLLTRRAENYSERPRFIVGSELLTGGLAFPLLSPNQRWRRMHRAAHEGLRRSVASSFHEIQSKEAIYLAIGVLEDSRSKAWTSHCQRFAASTIMSVTYDHPTLESALDPAYRKSDAVLRKLQRAATPMHGAHLVEIIPWMVRIPSCIARWKQEARRWFTHESKRLDAAVQEVKNSLEHGADRPSLTATMIKGGTRSGLSPSEMAWTAATMYIAGSDNTSVSMEWWIVAMAAYPDIQRRAHAEIDSVVGHSRLPSFADLPCMPYVRAMVKELLRWRQPLFGLPHSSKEDDWYNGMFIPKGTICLANMAACNRDPDLYGENADLFDPSRFLDSAGKLVEQGPGETREEGHVSYGFGRRVCVGRHIANNSLFIAIATMLWATIIEPVKDGNGDSLVDIEAYADTWVTSIPAPYQCTIRPRFAEALALLKEERERNISS
ncbi:cytochrome P450 [Amylostereum chailletii]|nr:cytochrome P450 [Amylostereum chailletii]